MTRVCVWGDSITYGYSGSEGGWCDLLKRYFLNNHKEKDISIYNLGISGDNSDDLLFRFEVEIKARDPDVIICAIGINDSQYVHTKDNPRVCLENYKRNLQELAEIANKFTHKILFIGLTPVDETKTTPIPWDSTKHYDSEQVQKYDQALQDFCKEKDLLYVDVKHVIELKDMEDGLHPDTSGHKKMFEVIKEAVLKVL